MAANTNTGARTLQGMKGPDRSENGDKLDTRGLPKGPSHRRKVVAAQRIWVRGSPGARTPNLRIKSLPDHTADNRISSDCNGFRPTQTLSEPLRPVKKGPQPRA